MKMIRKYILPMLEKMSNYRLEMLIMMTLEKEIFYVVVNTGL
jgi:hypothetical protein